MREACRSRRRAHRSPPAATAAEGKTGNRCQCKQKRIVGACERSIRSDGGTPPSHDSTAKPLTADQAASSKPISAGVSRRPARRRAAPARAGRAAIGASSMYSSVRWALRAGGHADGDRRDARGRRRRWRRSRRSPPRRAPGRPCARAPRGGAAADGRARSLPRAGCRRRRPQRSGRPAATPNSSEARSGHRRQHGRLAGAQVQLQRRLGGDRVDRGAALDPADVAPSPRSPRSTDTSSPARCTSPWTALGVPRSLHGWPPGPGVGDPVALGADPADLDRVQRHALDGDEAAQATVARGAWRRADRPGPPRRRWRPARSAAPAGAREAAGQAPAARPRRASCRRSRARRSGPGADDRDRLIGPEDGVQVGGEDDRGPVAADPADDVADVVDARPRRPASANSRATSSARAPSANVGAGTAQIRRASSSTESAVSAPRTPS